MKPTYNQTNVCVIHLPTIPIIKIVSVGYLQRAVINKVPSAMKNRLYIHDIVHKSRTCMMKRQDTQTYVHIYMDDVYYREELFLQLMILHQRRKEQPLDLRMCNEDNQRLGLLCYP